MRLYKIFLKVLALAGFIKACAPISNIGGSNNTSANSVDTYLLAQNAVNVFIVAGQSNAHGNGNQWDASIDIPKNDRVMQWNRFSKTIVHAKERLHHHPTKTQNKTGFGAHFGVKFSRSNNNAKVLLIPTAEGGTGFSYAGNKSGYWQVNSIAGPDGPGPSLTVDSVLKAIEASKAANPNMKHVIRGVLWHQGESDTIVNMAQNDYQDALARLVHHLRSSLADDVNQIRFVVGGMAPEWVSAQSQNVVRALEGVSHYIEGAAYASASGLTGNPGDIIHFDSASQRTLASRYLDAYNSISGVKKGRYEGSAGNDDIDGDDQSNTMRGLDGDDNLRGLGGDDIINGNNGNDFINGNIGNDILRGGAGNDIIRGGPGGDSLYGDKGDDSLFGDKGNDIYFYRLGDGNDSIVDSAGSDSLNCVGVSVINKSRDGNDLLIRFNDGSIRIKNYYVGMKIEKINCGPTTVDSPPAQPNLPAPSVCNDFQVNGEHTADDSPNRICGSIGRDVIRGMGGDDYIRGMGGDDIINGSVGNDTINGNEGNDIVRGGSENDVVRGGSGNDEIHGDFGDDKLFGDFGDDKLFGGPDNDTYYYNSGGGSDLIKDSSGGNDSLSCPDHTNVTVQKNQQGNDLILTIDGGKITIIDHFSDGRIENIDCGR